MAGLRQFAARAIDGAAVAARRVLIAAVRGYRFAFSPWLGNRCRFAPSCSAYALQALQRHGAVPGTYLAVRRVCRCHPWGSGGYDPVPEQVVTALPALWRRVQLFFRGDARICVPAPPSSNDKNSP